VTDEDFIEIAKKLISDAKAGDAGARTEFFNRILGRCLEVDVIEMIDELKREIVDIKSRR
jgi:hypothetical protein